MGLEQQNIPKNTVGGLPVSQKLAAVNDSVILAVRGADWASVSIAFATQAGGPQYAIAYSIDGGINYITSGSGAPYIKRIDAAAANPTVQVGAALAVSNQTHEFVLAANVTHVRVIVTTAGTAQNVTMQGFQPFIAGVPVSVVAYDVSVTAGANNNTGTLDGSGWSSLSWVNVVATATTGTQVINEVDDAGAAVAIASSASLATGTYVGALGVGVSMGTGITPVTGLTQVPLPKRFNFTLSGATTSAIRLRLVFHR